MLFERTFVLFKRIVKKILFPIKNYFNSDLSIKLDTIEFLIRDLSLNLNMNNHSQDEVPEFKRDQRFLTACDIGNLEVLLSQNTSFPHPVGIVISSQAKIGYNCKIWQNVTIGAKTIEQGLLGKYPKIGNNVQIFAGAVIVGDINIGDNALIAANAVVISDVKPNSIMGGVPAKKIGTTLSKELAQFTKEEDSKIFNEKIENLKESEIVASLSKESICIDCGANLGDVTAIFSAKGARVYAFEPHPVCFNRLQQRFSKDSNIVLFNKGVMDRKSTGRLYHSDFSAYDPEFFSQSSSVYSSKINVAVELYDDIELVDLISFITSLDTPVDILKLDVEGAEFCILEKIITENLHLRIKHILVETHDDRIPEIRDCANRVRSMIKNNNISNIDLTWC